MFSIRVQIPGGSSPSQRKSDELSECLFATCVMMKEPYKGSQNQEGSLLQYDKEASFLELCEAVSC